MMRKRRYIVIAIALITLVLITVLGEIGRPSPGMTWRIEPNYKGCVGIEYEGEINYAWMLSQYGEPDSVKTIKREQGYYIVASYEYLSFKFSAEDTDLENADLWTAISIRTTDSEHSFGKKKIHVGSSRESVIRAYSKAIAVKEAVLGEEYFEGVWGFVAFTYDENDAVTSIEFSLVM